ncbi:DMT family transporter [Myxococcota bacterium]|nr:DMT family transporter [Myxococcota bacterium]
MNGARVALALGLALGALSFAAPLFRLAAPTHPLVAAGLRLLLAAVILAPFALRALRVGRFPAAHRRGAVVAGLCYGLHFGAWVSSLTMTTVAASVTLVTCTPLLLGVLGAVTGRDPPTPRFWGALACAAAGLVVIGGADLMQASPGALLGDALALLGAFSIAGYFLTARRLGPTLDVTAFSAVAVGVGALSLLGTAQVLGVPLAPASPSAAAAIVACTLVPQLVGHSLLTWALRHTGPAYAAMATVGEPVGATLLTWWWLDESPTPTVLLGCSVTLTGVALALMASAGRGRDARSPTVDG